MLSLYGLVTLATVHVKLPRLTLNLAVRKMVYAHFLRLAIVHRRPNLALTRSFCFRSALKFMIIFFFECSLSLHKQVAVR